MMSAPVEAPALIREMEAPEHLRRKCAEMRASAPSFGLGFHKGRLPPLLFERLQAHFRANVGRFRTECEIEEIGTVDQASIPTLIYEDEGFNAQLAAELKPLHEAWAGVPLTLSYCYGIRCYQPGTFLYNHVDRQPHFVSATICVDHQLNSPWPLHIEDVNGAVSQVNLEPGEFVFYEGTTLVHGRPYPLDGDFYAGIFVHFHPANLALSG